MMKNEVSIEYFITYLNSILGSIKINTLNDLESFLYVYENKHRLGSPSVNSIVMSLGNKYVLKKSRLDVINTTFGNFCKDWTLLQFNNARIVEQEINRRINVADKSLEHHFNNISNIIFTRVNIRGNDYSLLIEKKMDGCDFGNYVDMMWEKVLQKHISRNEFEVRLCYIISVISDIILRMYRLGINHNDLHNRNIFMKNIENQYAYKLLNGTIVNIDAIPILFDFDWTSIDGRHKLLECVKNTYNQHKYTEICNFPFELERNINERIYDVNIQKYCEYFAQMFRFSWQYFPYPSPKIDFARFMLYFTQQLNDCLKKKRVNITHNTYHNSDDMIMTEVDNSLDNVGVLTPIKIKEFPILLKLFQKSYEFEFDITKCHHMLQSITCII